ncbi:MAG: cardiolipin synthase [Chloroflexi bacterium]|nr:cardiolipin synthase [Chloroflexota bacterium]
METTTIYYLLAGLLALYALGAYIFLVIDNRSPQSTFAWLFLFYIFPLGGIVIYALFGRGHHAFSDESKLLKQIVGGDLSQPLAPWLSQQDEAIEKLKTESRPAFRRLPKLLHHSSCACLTLHNHLEILQNAQEKYPRLVEDIKAAQQSIHLEYFEWAADPFTEELKQILIGKARAGVEVRVLFDPVGSFAALRKRYVREMNVGGVKMYPFSPLYKLHTIGYRNYRKIAVIDGKIGYTGGINMSQAHLNGPEGFTGWRDTHVRLTGEAVRVLQATFLTSWYNGVGEKLVSELYLPPLTEAHGYLPVQVVNSGPDSEWQAIRQLYFFLILAAEDHVYIQSPFFILDESIAEALRAAALSGIEVKVMLAPAGAEGQLPYQAGRTYAAAMIRAGVQVYYYHGAYFHPKTIMVDSAVCSIGSANMDIRSFSINYETNLVIYDETTTQQLENDFLSDLKHCAEFSLAEYKKSFLVRLGDSTTRLFSPLL